MKIGYIKLYRKIEENESLNEKPFTKRDAWIDLLLHANYIEKEVWIKNTKYLCKPGEQLRSQRNIALHWGWSRKRVQTFLGLLEKEAMLGLKREPHTTRIKIINWDTYQAEGDLESHERARGGATTEPRRSTTKNIKEVKEVKKNIYRAEARRVIDFLNEKAGRNFDYSKTSIGFVESRLKELNKERGKTVEDAGILMRKVVSLKVQDSFFMEKGFLRPSTLYNKTKFNEYLEEVITYGKNNK